jgi:hypothetical protein
MPLQLTGPYTTLPAHPLDLLLLLLLLMMMIMLDGHTDCPSQELGMHTQVA